MKHTILAIAFSTVTLVANAQLFDWGVLQGKWAESTRNLYGCRPDNLHQTFVVSEDKKQLTFKLDRPWKIGTGQEVREYSAWIVAQGENTLIIRYGSELEGIPDEMREWEMRFIGPGTYRWRATAWAPHEFNNVIGVKCTQ